MTCHRQYMSVVLNERILKQIDYDSVSPVLTMRLWYRQNYRVDKTIGKFTLRLTELYEKQLSEQMAWQMHPPSHHSHQSEREIGGRVSKRGLMHSNSRHHGGPHFEHEQTHDTFTDLFVGYKMTMNVKQKKINRFLLDKQLYIESFIRFCSVDDVSRMSRNNMRPSHQPRGREMVSLQSLLSDH